MTDQELIKAIDAVLDAYRAEVDEPGFDPESTTEGEPVRMEHFTQGFAEASRQALERLNKISDVLAGSLPQPKPPEPIAEVGDMIKVNGNWLRVKQYDADHNRGRPAYLAGPDDHDAADWWGQHAIEDVYTKAEQERGECYPDCPTHGLEACKMPEPGFDGSCDPHPDDSWVSGSHDPAPEIPESWDLITAGDGRTRIGRGLESIIGRYWVALDDPFGTDYTDAEILATGQVRRAVVVTLPDLADVMPADLGLDAEGRWVFGGFSSRDPEYLRKRSAEMLAAAIKAEEGEK